MTEARVDLHTHTSYSEDREQIALPHGASVTLPFYPVLSPFEAFELALERGMTHVTFTDHDTIDGCLDLLDRIGDDERFIIGQEVTCYCHDVPVHVGVFGLTEEDHRRIHQGADRTDRERRCLRWDLPALLGYLDERGLPYDLKHPLWSRDGTLRTRQQWVELFGMFPLVEAINGTRHGRLNDLGVVLARRYGGPRVAFTGGSDSHTTRIGRAYTRTRGRTRQEVLESLRTGDCEAVGEHGSHHTLDRDIRTCINSNMSRQASQFIALADDYMRDIPQLARELLSLMLSGTIAFAVVHEFGRQRALAQAVAELFADASEGMQGDHGQVLAAPDPGRVVHGHVRRD